MITFLLLIMLYHILISLLILITVSLIKLQNDKRNYFMQIVIICFGNLNLKGSTNYIFTLYFVLNTNNWLLQILFLFIGVKNSVYTYINLYSKFRKKLFNNVSQYIILST